MNIVIHNCEQRSPEWFELRAGKPTGSVADAVVAKLKSGGEPASRRDLRTQLAIELLTGRPVETDGFVNREMQRGIDCEPLAVGAYEAATGEFVERVGFVERTDLGIGCSPDGLLRAGGLIRGVLEVKAPKSATHIGYLRDRRVPPEYRAQLAHNLLVTGAEFVDFVSFDDRLPADLQFFHIRATAKDLDVAGYETELRRFLNEVQAELAALRALRAAA